MLAIFTICSNNYLAQAKVLYDSVRINVPQSTFFIFLVDVKRLEIDYTKFAEEVIEVSSIEPDFDKLADQFNIIELNTSVKPRAIEYLFEEKAATFAIYLDPDIKVYSHFADLQAIMQNKSIVLTPHILTPIPRDGRTPAENLFLNYGLYNLGFIAVTKNATTERFIKWWKEFTFNFGYDRVADGLFVDQLPINLVPLFFEDVHILEDVGYNMGPWNLHERFLSLKNDTIYVNNEVAMTFYHFSSFKIDTNELPVWRYDRYNMASRPDLHALYADYEMQIKSADYERLSKIKCAYVKSESHCASSGGTEQKMTKSIVTKLVVRLIKALPSGILKRLHSAFSQAV